MSISRISPEDADSLTKAKALLETPGLVVKLANYVGTPLEKGFARLPIGWQVQVGETTNGALRVALKGALLSMRETKRDAHPFLHKVAETISGGIGGAFGLPALLLELPLSTTIMLRSIADIGRSCGEDLSISEARLACLEVFALSGPMNSDEVAEGGYFAVRTALAKAVHDAAEFLAEKAIVEDAAPALVRLIGIVASRFQIPISTKMAAQALPIIGAATGSAINLMFMEHYQGMAKGHFTVRRLERKYGKCAVRSAYLSV